MSEHFEVHGVPGPLVVPNTDQLVEAHFIGSTQTDWYVDGTLFATDTTGNSGSGISATAATLEISWAPSPTATTTWSMGSLTVGSSRGASDIFADPMTSVPVVPPWQSALYCGGSSVGGSPPPGWPCGDVSTGGLGLVFGQNGMILNVTWTAVSDAWLAFHIDISSALIANANDRFMHRICSFGDSSVAVFWEDDGGVHVWQRF